jgi:hypothetical protein
MPRSTEIGPIWVFDKARLDEALAAYEAEALAAYPHQAERIRTTVAAMRDFFDSEHARDLRMPLVSGQG